MNSCPGVGVGRLKKEGNGTAVVATGVLLVVGDAVSDGTLLGVGSVVALSGTNCSLSVLWFATNVEKSGT